MQVYSFNRRVENLFNSYFLHYENIAIKLDEHQISISLLDEHNEDPASLELIKFVDHHQITFWDGYSQSEIIEEKKRMIVLKKEYSQNIENGEKKLTVTNAELQKQKSLIDLKQSVFRETYDSIDKIQTKIKLEQKDRESILENLKLSEFKLNELKQKI